MDLLMDLDTHDLVFINGECPVTNDRIDVVTQRLMIRLKTFRGEWFMDTEYGPPYWDILGNKVSKDSVDLRLQSEILAEQGVKEITYFESSIENRTYSMRFKIKVTNGDETDTLTFNLG